MNLRMRRGLGALLALVALPLLALGALSVFGLDWARAPLEAQVLARTGRALRIDGPLGLEWGWPALRFRADTVRYANPAWAREPQLLSADRVMLSLDLGALLRGRLAIPELRLTRPQVFLEQASGGRKTWLLDRSQTDEDSRVPIGRLLLDQGELHYADAAAQTDLHATLATRADGGRLLFRVEGRFHGQALAGEGEGGAVMALRAEHDPYPLRVQATLGRTQVQAEGTLTNLLRFDGVDLRITLGGDSLATLYAAIGVALPPTPAYRSSGHLLRRDGVWRYEQFSAQMGHSEFGGTLQVAPAGERKRLSGELVFERLSLADLGPAAGLRDTAGAATVRVLPDLPLDISHWPGLEADVTLRVRTLLSRQALPMRALYARLQLQEARLTLEPIAFDWAGGQVTARLLLDGSRPPLRGQAKVTLRGVAVAQLMPASAATGGMDLGRLDADAELAGQGASVGQMLAAADGRLRVQTQGGQVSRLLMEKSGLHLLEILRLSLAGDETVRVNCTIADFNVARGVMQPRTLVLDTEVNTLVGEGRIDLSTETLDLAIVPHTKQASLVALRAPVHLRGSFAQPVLSLDSGRVALRGAGAVALGLVNPLLALVPLFEAGPGMADACRAPAR